MKLTRTLLLMLVALVATHGYADFDLQVTEVSPFGTDYNDPEDPDNPNDVEWMEVTNLGDMDWVESPTTMLFYDDQVPVAGNADPIIGITNIAVGESVIMLNEDGAFPDIATAIGVFQNEHPSYTGQFGTYNGSGMSSGNADGAALWVAEENPDGGAFGDPVSSLAYDASTDPDGHPLGQSFSPSGWGAPTPGTFVPEPSAGLMALLGMIGLLAIRRK